MGTISVAQGGIAVEEKTFRWEIHNFNLIVKNEGLLKSKLLKQRFEVTDSRGIKSCWRFWITYDAAEDEEDEEPDNEKNVQLNFALMRKEGFCSEIDAEVSAKVEDTVGTPYFSSNIKYKGSGHDFRKVAREVWYWDIDELNPENELELLGGTLVIIITLKIFGKIASSVKDVEMANADENKICARRKEQFYRKIAKLENDEANSDVKIISSDGREFFAYRWILAEVSDVFEAMFRSEMSEKKSGVVEFNDLSGTTVKLLLHFIYTGKIGPQLSLAECVEGLVYAADKYQIEELKVYLDFNLGKICTVENAGTLLILAKKMSMKKATEEILVFIQKKCKNADNFIDIVSNTKIH